jgi:hypothetical protein
MFAEGLKIGAASILPADGAEQGSRRQGEAPRRIDAASGSSAGSPL